MDILAVQHIKIHIQTLSACAPILRVQLSFDNNHLDLIVVTKFLIKTWNFKYVRFALTAGIACKCF